METVMEHVLVVLSSLYLVTASVIQDVIVTTRYGQLQGTRESFEYDLGPNKVTSVLDKFKGVPFAQPPVNDLRFRPPVPPMSWSGVRNATEYSWVCPQISFFHPDTKLEFQNEDCLHLNIYTPFQELTLILSTLYSIRVLPEDEVKIKPKYEEEDPLKLYPVMFYIHGGSYEVGAGRLYNGEVLAMYGVVVVTINYRLGALGFLSSGDESMAGNYGILDQIQALKWVNQNIHSFRGDPDKVTIFGHSAGGASVGLILATPSANGLYVRALAQSGSATASFSIHDASVAFHDYIRKVGSIFGCHATPIPEVVECLRTVPAYMFIKNRREFPWFDPIDPEFRPVVDGVMLPDSPRKLLQTGNYNKVPLLVGTVKNEFGNYFNGGARHKPAFDKALDNYVSKITGARPALLDLVRYEYTDWRGVQHLHTATPFLDRGALLSDMHMVAPMVDMATLVAEHQSEVYEYYFTTHKSYHSVELNYVFGAPFSGHFADEMTAEGVKSFTEKDKERSRLMMSLWTNFAKYGHPTPTDQMNITWQEFTRENMTYLHLAEGESRMRQHLRADKVTFWNVLFPRLKASIDPLDQSIQRDVTPPSSMDLVQYRIQMYTFLGIAAALLLLIVILLFLLIRARMSNERFRHWTRTYENGPTRPARV